MILFWTAAALLIAGVLGTLLWPLIRQRDAMAGDRGSIVAVFRRQLQEIEAELGFGTISLEEAAAARTEIKRHMLAAADREGRRALLPEGSRTEISWRMGTAVALAGVIPIAALLIYFQVGAPGAINAAHGSSAQALAAAADVLAARLHADPDHPRGWILLARTSASLGRYGAAKDAYQRAIKLRPGDTELHAELGEVIMLQAGGKITPAALAQFEEAPHDPRARYYLAEEALQRGDVAAARSQLSSLLADAPSNAPWRPLVEKRLAAISGKKVMGPAAVPAPNAAALAAAQQMTSQQRRGMIDSMVARLAARLKVQPNDPQGWLMLARSYRMLGRGTDAIAALKRANQAVPGNPAVLEAYMAALGGSVGGGRLTPEFVALATRLHAIDSKETGALWYLGLDAAAHGDPSRARQYWAQLLAELPAGEPARAVVARRLAALH